MNPRDLGAPHAIERLEKLYPYTYAIKYHAPDAFYPDGWQDTEWIVEISDTEEGEYGRAISHKSLEDAINRAVDSYKENVKSARSA